MKKILSIAALSIIGYCSTATAQQENQEAWMKYMQPAQMHHMLKMYNGKFNERVMFWQSPEREPMVMEATATVGMILGDRYQQSIHKGTMMGMPFEGVSTMAYDNAREVFISTWIDNMGTGIMYSEGKFNPENREIELKGYTTDPATKKAVDFRQVIDLRDPNHQVITTYDTKDGKEYMSMRVEMMRAQE